MSRKKRTYTCPPATCPHPADHHGLAPLIHARVRVAYMNRMKANRTGAARAARAAAKAGGHGRKRKPSGKAGG
jgi:hypothetical protein